MKTNNKIEECIYITKYNTYQVRIKSHYIGTYSTLKQAREIRDTSNLEEIKEQEKARRKTRLNYIYNQSAMVKAHQDIKEFFNKLNERWKYL